MSTEDLASLYCTFLEEVKTRLGLVRSITEGVLTAGGEAFNDEVVAVNLRKTLELIAFGTLSANRVAYAKAHAKFAEHWSAKRLLKNLEQLHPDFYPKPVLRPKILQEGPPRHLHFDFVPDGFLTRDEFVELYDLCSQVIHTRNPFSQGTAINFRHSVPQWVSRMSYFSAFTSCA
jgi:hypothetical protein